MAETVVIAILAKDKEHCLPLYLKCLESQTWPASKSHVWVRTNNNNDNTAQVLNEWVEKVRDRYASIVIDTSDVETNIQQYKQHEWNCTRFKVLGAIRDASVQYAREKGAHYFVADCDNFITPSTIEALLNTNMPVIGPLLRRSDSSYANYHLAIDANGYYADHQHYHTILLRQVKGIFEVPVIHCTYLIRHEVLPKISYDDGSSRYEYVVIADGLRKHGVPQYIDNRINYGHLTFAEDLESLEREPWYQEMSSQ